MPNRIRIVALILSLSVIAAAADRRFVRAQGKDLVAPDGSKLLLRGINLGNWLVPEGYMFHFERGPSSAREIEALFNELVGPDEAARFWSAWRDQYITADDIRFLRDAGFNSVRIPFHYKLITDGNGFALLDRAIDWCRKAGIYVVLDMHCAPGGQTGTNIDDSWGYPWLFESPAEQSRTIDIWRQIAAHYRDEPTIIGYDLLNEPIPTYPKWKHLSPRLEPLYKRITAAIREVDQNHIVILGGAQWDSNFDVFGPPFDQRLMYNFHKYWTSPTQDVIQPYLDFRDRYNVPIWMSESGENKDDWIATFRTLLEKNGIGWAFWPYKKMDATSCVASFDRPEYWSEIVAYAQLPGSVGGIEKRLKSRPSNEHSRAALAALLRNIRFPNCRANRGYLNALLPNNRDSR